MERGWLYKILFIAVGAMALVWVLAPTYIYFSLDPSVRTDPKAFEAAVPGWMTKRHLNLGLDLQGGIHLVMGVEVEKAAMDRVQRRGEEIRSYAKEKEVPFESIKPLRDEAVLKVTMTAEQKEKFQGVILNYYKDMTLVSQQDDGLLIAFNAAKMDQVKNSAVDQAVKTIRNRVDAWGVSEPQIVRKGENKILIQLPGVKDPDQAKDLLGKTAQLEFRITQDHRTGFLNEHQDLLPEGVTLQTGKGVGDKGETIAYFLQSKTRKDLEAAREALLPFTPEDLEVAFQKQEKADGSATYRTYVLTATPGITGDYLVDARVATDQQRNGRPYVAFQFSQQGARIFEKLTEANIGRYMAVVLDNMVESAPVIQSKISERGQITLGSLKSNQDMLKEADVLALVLKAGALPAPVRILEERTVGSTLGPDLIKRGLEALMVGGILVLLFMPLYYKLSGIVADVSLVLNILLLMSILAVFGATLTLPGIAGIVLTVGMAVDSNVIIFERIREEVGSGKTAWAAVQAGYEQAFSAIFDGNLTTGIAAFVLLQYGTGPVRGFAVTLLAGILSTLATGYWCSRAFQEGLNSHSKSVSV